MRRTKRSQAAPRAPLLLALTLFCGLSAAAGTFQLFWAPDQGDGRQRVEMTTSEDFATWSAPAVITEGTDGETAYWDYWPEATPQGNKLNLFYTSERGVGGGDPGTGHIWTTRIR